MNDKRWVCLIATMAAMWLSLAVTGCALTPPEQQASAPELATRAGWQTSRLASGRFKLLAMHPAPRPTRDLAIFIEGDGLAWLDRYTPSSDPTPRNPMALRLALAETHRTSAYLARPCQYTPGLQGCTLNDWTRGRFSSEVIAAMDDAVTQLKQRFGAERLLLVGYSGGGTIAALLAARRQDVSLLVTVAAVLDHEAWTRAQRVSPLDLSLNPANEWQALRGLRQVHFVGTRDTQTGRLAVQPFVDRFPPGERPAVEFIDNYTHQCCWAEAWSRLSPLAPR